MKTIEHVKCCFTFWRPSVSRRMTLYFVIFGLLVFLATTAAHMIAAKKHFLTSAVRIVEHQIGREQAGLPPDIIWQSIGRERPELTTLAHLLASVSSAFYTVADMAVYCRLAGSQRWQRLNLDANQHLSSGRWNPPRSEPWSVSWPGNREMTAYASRSPKRC